MASLPQPQTGDKEQGLLGRWRRRGGGHGHACSSPFRLLSSLVASPFIFLFSFSLFVFDFVWRRKERKLSSSLPHHTHISTMGMALLLLPRPFQLSCLMSSLFGVDGIFVACLPANIPATMVALVILYPTDTPHTPSKKAAALGMVLYYLAPCLPHAQACVGMPACLPACAPYMPCLQQPYE